MTEGPSELLDRRDRCELIAELCRVRFSRPMNAHAVDQVLRLVMAIAAEEHEGDLLGGLDAEGRPRYVAAVDREGRLGHALRLEFGPEHAVWAYVRWQ